MIQTDNGKDFSKKYNESPSFKKSRSSSGGNKEFLDIWHVNPSFTDINRRIAIPKGVFLITLPLLSMIALYIETKNVTYSLILSVILLIAFISVFHDGIFSLNMVYKRMFHKMIIFNPFKPYIFWFNDDTRQILYIHNKEDLITFAMKIYDLTIIPDSIHPNVGGFIRALSVKNIRLSYSYQVVQKPLIDIFNASNNTPEFHNRSASKIGKAYFTVFGRINGILTSSKIDQLHYHLHKYAKQLESTIVSNFHHFQYKLLSNQGLLNALRTLYIGINVQGNDANNKELGRNTLKSFIPKFSIALFILIYFGWICTVVFHFSMTYTLIIVLFLTFFLVFIWWRSLLFEISRRVLLKNEKIDRLYPFEKVLFFTLRTFPYSLFMHIDNQLLIGMKMVNLKYIYNNYYYRIDPKYDSRLEHTIEFLNTENINFTYTLKNEPLFYYTFAHNGLKNVYERQRKYLLQNIITKREEEQWLLYRKGMWYSFLTFAINNYKLTNTLESDIIEEMEETLNFQMDTLRGAFESNFQSFEIEDLKTNRLTMSYLFSVFKHNKFKINGSHLYYLMLQGDTLTPLSTPVSVLRRSIESRLPAEFNTPTFLRNFIIIGHTINTEVLKKEIPFGLLYEQAKNLLIVNGITKHRQLAAMKIVSELITQGKPTLIFDFNGQWTKILSFFEETPTIDTISHFRLGTAFTTNPLISDIPYDTHNTDYIEHMFDAFALAFKKDHRTIDMFRSVISKNPDMDLSSMALEAQTQSDWQKTPLSYTLQNIFSDLTPQDKTYFQSFQGSNKISAHDFIRSERSVIIDLSILKDLNKQLFFAFLILAKIIHYTKHSDDYIPKIIVIPYIDLFFEQRFLDLRWNYGKISSFLDPLINKDFGFICSANQIHYLHPHIFTYFHNIITFRATDKRDIGILQNILRLQETPGIGEYSDKRHRKYQIEYLKDLTDNNILVKREDIHQSFPAKLNWKKILVKDDMSYDQILILMTRQGYDLREHERRILDGARQTIFEKDLGQYYYYIDEIINFFTNISSFDGIGNFYQDKVKKLLKEILYPKLRQRTNNRSYMKKIRDEIFEILVKQGYLVEDHSRRASGSETLATSYKIGNQYYQALDDYYTAKGSTPEVNLEQIKEDFFPSQTRKYIVQQDNLIEALAREFSDFNYDIFKIYNFIEKEQYSNALKIEQIIIKKFLFNVYRQYYNIDRAVMPSEVGPFFNLLEEIEDFPFKAEQLKNYINEHQNINLDIDNPKKIALEAYESLYNFFIKIQNYIYKRE
ncbi:MAG: hypothetical protein ACFFC3_03710 [Candidatus Odinarchaeota archaeon]